MKELGEGDWNKPWSKKVTCSEPSCKAPLLVEEQDLMAPAILIGHSKRYTFKCPKCGKENDLDPNDLSTRVREALDTKREVEKPGHWGGLSD